MTNPSDLIDIWTRANTTLATNFQPGHYSPSDVLRLALWLDGADPQTIAASLGPDVQRSSHARG